MSCGGVYYLKKQLKKQLKKPLEDLMIARFTGKPTSILKGNDKVISVFRHDLDSCEMEDLRVKLFNLSNEDIISLLYRKGLVLKATSDSWVGVSLYSFFKDLISNHCSQEYYMKLEQECRELITDKHMFGHYEFPMYSCNGNNHINCRSHYTLESAMPTHQKEELENGILDALSYTGNVLCNIEKGDENMKIKKTDELSIEEFKETDKAYDSVFVVFDMDKYEKIAREYGDVIAPRTGIIVHGVRVYGRYLENIIEFYPKAISLRSEGDMAIYTIPYYIVDKVICTYYIEK